MKNANVKLIFGLLALACIFFVACHNSVMERWWGDQPGQEPDPVPVGPVYHVVSFEVDGGSPAVGDQLIAHEGRVARVPALSKEHHGFGGWFRNASRTGDVWDFATDTVDRDITLFARWVPVSYVITFEANGGSPAPADQVLFSGAIVKEPPPMNRARFGFGGWFTDASFTGEAWNFATDTANGNLTLYARWTETFCTVMFMDKGVILGEQQIACGGRVVEPLPVRKEHHAFAGWFTDERFTDRWDFATRTVNNNLTLYARWERDRYTVTFIAIGGLPQPPQQQISYLGKAVEPPPMNRAGFGFGGWFTDEGFTNEWTFDMAVDENLTLYARWKTDFYTVTFNANDGSPVPTNQQIARGRRIVQPPPMNHPAGHGFGGWFTDEGFTNEWTFDMAVDENLTLYARWETDFYTVTFAAGGGQPAPAAQRILHGSKATTPAPMTRTGFSFGGWFTNANFTGDAWNFTADPVEGTLTLHARWDRYHPTVTFVANGGEPPPAGQRVLYGDTIIRPAPVTRTGFTFGGWFTNINFAGNAWDFNTDIVLGDITLYARWEQNPTVFTVRFDADPGVPMEASNASPWPETQRIVDGMRAVAPATLRKRFSPGSDLFYGFGGWFTANGTGGNWGTEWNFATNTVSRDITLYAKWDEPHSIVTFMPDGGTPAPGTQDLIAGARVKEPLAMTKLGHGFAGWFTDQAFTTQWNFATDTVSAETLVLYARWVTLRYNVKFEANGGTPAPDDQIVVHGNRIQSPKPMTKTGMGFLGWYTSTDVRWNFDTDTVDRHMTLEARWSLTFYIVSFETSPSTVTIADQLVAFGGNVVPPTNPPQLGDGRAFGGWFTGNGTYNEWGRQWDFSNDKITDAMTLYARWVYQTRTVVFMVNGGTDMSQSHFTINILAGGRILSPGSPSRAGHTFGGWFTDLAFTQQWNFTADRLTEPDEAPGVDPFYLYARWFPNIYTVSFNVNSGTASHPSAQTVRHGERVARPEVTNPGMALVGWYTNSGLTNEWDFDNGLVSSNMTLHASWEVARFTVTFNLRMPLGNAPHPQPADQSVTYNCTIAEPFMLPLPSTDITSWSFLRWDYSTDGTGNTATLRPWDFNNTLTENITLYARWVPPVPDMVWVPRGRFVMGEAGVSGSSAAYHAYPTRTVTLDGFYISRNLVTQEEFERIMNGNPFGITARPSQFQAGQPTRPVERVSWYDALAFANALSESRGLGRVFNILGWDTAVTMGVTNISRAFVDVDWDRHGFRLPTEAEWEFAARGGNGSPGNFVYAGSNNADEVAWFNTNSGSQTRPVGSKQPNDLGIFDMNGNVSEWCWDWFDSYKNMIAAHPFVEANNNPRGPDHGTERVRRGGSWNNVAGNVRNVVRNSATPDSANWVIGFRLALSPDPNLTDNW